MSDTFVTSVIFNDEALELTFLESREQGENVMEVHTLVFPVNNDMDKLNLVATIQEILRELIDRVYSERRNPPKKEPVENQRDAIDRVINQRGEDEG